MPKEENTRTNSLKSRTRASPYPCNGSSSRHRVSSSSSPITAQEDTKEWEEARCSVCMEHPHNAVLLTCTSVKKGCRPFMCDTSYRHSNCLDQYKKAFAKISCPLCRGSVDGWSVDKSARRYMDSKVRSCSKESCGFSGTYLELRKHARKEHPMERPSTADPERQQDWQRMVQRRDFEDLMSTMRGELNGEEDGGGGGGFDRLFNEDENEVGLVGRLRISPIAVLLLIRYTFRMDESLERVSSTSPRRSPSLARVSLRSSDEESSDAEYANEDDETAVGERRWRARERQRRRRMRFPEDENDDDDDDASDAAVRVRRRLTRLSPVAESDDAGNDEVAGRVQARPRRRRMRLLPDDGGDDDGGGGGGGGDRVEERPRRRRMRLLDEESDDYL